MSLEENKRVLQELAEELINKGDLATADRFYSADSVDHAPVPGQVAGPEGVKGDCSKLCSMQTIFQSNDRVTSLIACIQRFSFIRG